MKNPSWHLSALALLGLCSTCADVGPPLEPPLVEDCGNGEDDDDDGKRDCADSDCAANAACQEDCDNAQDDDFDGNFDCADPDCAGASNCQPESDCTNTVDDDNDGQIDCADSDCAAQEVCQICDPDNDLCEGEEICIVDECQPAFNRIYRFSGFVLALGPVDPNGGNWDGSNDPPDPKVELFLNGTKFLETAKKDNSFNATYSETVTRQIPAGSEFEVRVLDVDGNADDLALSCVANPLSADLLRARSLLCEDTSIDASLRFTIEPN